MGKAQKDTLFGTRLLHRAVGVLKGFLRRNWKIAAPVFIAVIITIPVVFLAFASPAPRHEPQTVDEPAQEERDTEGEEAATPQAAPAPPPPPVAPPKPIPPSPPSPHSVLGLGRWKLTLPVNTERPGTPDEIVHPELATFSQSPYFRLTDAGNGVIFQAPTGGATTKNSKYPRSELREMTSDGKKSASWSNTAGTHTMTVRQAITHLPVAKPEVVAGQIHDASDDVIMIRLEGQRLFVESDGDDVGLLDPSYALGAVFTVKIEAAGGRIKVFYNGEQKVDYAKSGSGYYFKAGCYTQSNPSKGDSPNAYGEVVIYSLHVSHT